MFKYSFSFLFTLLIVVLVGCASKPSVGGSVNFDTRNFNDFSREKTTKTVNYYCNFERIATQDFSKSGDYCLKADNHDYVSYFIPFDIQSTTEFKSHLTRTVSEAKRTGKSYKYYQIYSGNNLNRLLTFDFDISPPTSFAIIVDNDSYFIALTKKDLLARYIIYPGLNIRSLQPVNETESDRVDGYTVTFSIPPYSFKAQYEDSVIGRLLGLPNYYQLTGVLDGNRKLDLSKYNESLADYWSFPNKYKYSHDMISIVDYAIPRLGAEKFKNSTLPSDLDLRPEPLIDQEGYINDYLPYYRLRSIEIVQLSDNIENVLKTFSGDDIAEALISLNDYSALVYKGSSTEGRVVIRYNHEAEKPNSLGISNYYSESLGVGYIYSDIASLIETNLNIEKFYTLEKLPVNCMDIKKITETMNKRGVQRDKIDYFVSRLSKEKYNNCTAVQKSINDILPDFY